MGLAQGQNRARQLEALRPGISVIELVLENVQVTVGPDDGFDAQGPSVFCLHLAQGGGGGPEIAGTVGHEDHRGRQAFRVKSLLRAGVVPGTPKGPCRHHNQI